MKNVESLFEGYPNFGPSKVRCLQNKHPSAAYDPTFLLKNPFTLKNVDVNKKLKLNPLRFDQDIRVLSQKKYFQKFLFVRPANEKHRKSAGFQVFSEIKFFYMISYYPLILYVV